MLPVPAYCLIVVMTLCAACTKPWSSTYTYNCPDGYSFTVTYSDTDHPGDIAVLTDAEGRTKLPRAPTASGIRYSNEALEFFSRGDAATIRRAGTIAHDECTPG